MSDDVWKSFDETLRSFRKTMDAAFDRVGTHAQSIVDAAGKATGRGKIAPEIDTIVRVMRAELVENKQREALLVLRVTPERWRYVTMGEDAAHAADPADARASRLRSLLVRVLKEFEAEG